MLHKAWKLQGRTSLDLKLTKDIPYLTLMDLTLMGKLCGVCCENLRENWLQNHSTTGITLGMGLANESRRYIEMPSFYSRGHTQNDPCTRLHDICW